MLDQPKVTIGMPVFNGEKFLVSAIDSIFAQTFPDFELIISDNGSTDRTQRICEDYVSQDHRVRYIRQVVNRGAIANFNLLVERARGNYFKWAAHDDVCEPTYLEQCVEVLDSHPDVVLCHCDSDMIDVADESWLKRMPEDDEEVEVDAKGNRKWAGLPRVNHNDSSPSKRFAGVLLGTRWCVDSYGLIRTEVLRRTGLYPNIYGSEKVLVGELALYGKFHQVPLCLFKQRIHTAASAYQDDIAAQQQFVQARHARPFSSTRLQLLCAHFAVARRVETSRWERFRCYVALLRYVFQFQKWHRVISRALHRKGVGGGGRRIIEIGTQNSSRLSSEIFK
jgi:glycosyltransferase involved in cell wall biosynthesis